MLHGHADLRGTQYYLRLTTDAYPEVMASAQVRTMKLAVLAAFEQRVALRYAMPPMTSQETSSYTTHHLRLAGRSDTLFSDDAVALIHTTARGYPRAVNNLALQALVATYASGKAIVDEQAARAAITEVTDT